MVKFLFTRSLVCMSECLQDKEKENLDPEQIFQFSFHLMCLNGFCDDDDDDHEIFIIMHYL